jgi:iron(III) transport system substrate-binding protein
MIHSRSKNLLLSVLATTGTLFLSSGCNHKDSKSSQDDQALSVTLYTSVDDSFAKMVIDEFTKETGIHVDLLGDTEATKTTGLVTRILAEQENPSCDVWWSSEPMGTILLDESGALESNAMIGKVREDWPTTLRSDDWSWVGIAMRARVIAYPTQRVEDAPTTLARLTDPTFKGRVGMARPQFGTTRIHMASLADQWGVDAFEDWLVAMESNSIRLYDGNARVVQAIAMGEIDIGLTDTDDVWAGQANGWDIGLVYESLDEHPRWSSSGPMLIPNTVAIIKNAPNPEPADILAGFLVSPRVEELLYESKSRNIPIHQELRNQIESRDGAELLPIDKLPDYQGAADKVREAMDACEQVLISP